MLAGKSINVDTAYISAKDASATLASNQAATIDTICANPIDVSMDQSSQDAPYRRHDVCQYKLYSSIW